MNHGQYISKIQKKAHRHFRIQKSTVNLARNMGTYIATLSFIKNGAPKDLKAMSQDSITKALEHLDLLIDTHHV